MSVCTSGGKWDMEAVHSQSQELDDSHIHCYCRRGTPVSHNIDDIDSPHTPRSSEHPIP